jgi:preprotein translocase subunit SecD
MKRIQEFAIKQNITTLNNRINELGVAEPVIAQQGADRIVVQLPGVQDTAKAKDILGRTATLEIRMVDDTPGGLEAALAGQVPFGTELYVERGGAPLLVKKQVVLTGDRLTDAQPGFDGQTNEPAVHLTLDSAGARIFKDITRDNVGKRMAILLIEKGKGEVVTAPVIRAEIGGGRVQISGRMSTTEANDTALLLRAGSLAAPDGNHRGAHHWPEPRCREHRQGLSVDDVGLCRHRRLHDRLLPAVRPGLGDRPGLQPAVPGRPALLAAGHADPAGYRRHRADAGHGHRRQRADQRAHPRGTAQRLTPQAAIHTGYERAFGTILDSNVTTLIAGLALLIFGSGPVRGFAVVHCLGILTSMFSAVVVSRAMVNLIYGRRRKLESLAIGQVWKPLPPRRNDTTAAVK